MVTMDWTGQADGVFRGGGVKGLALAGAIVGCAEHPTLPVKEWKNVAGASAGAIIASYLAYDRSEKVGENMIALLDPEVLVSFQDFPLGRKYLGGIPRLVFRHGMASGNAFEKWFDGVLGQSTFSIAKTGDDWSKSRLKLIAADVTNRRLLVLPEDLPRYALPGTNEPIDPDTFPISKAARMSMSIPYFFQAVELDLVVDVDGNPVNPPRRSYIVDGGTLSNFPVWLFDSPNPSWPTFGFTLTGGTGVGGGIKKLRKLLPWSARTAFDIFHTAQEAWDVRFQTHSTQVRTFAVSATVVENGVPFAVNTTDFKLSKAHQDGLIENGKNAATEFLDNFKLEDYFNTLHDRLGPPAPSRPAPA